MKITHLTITKLAEVISGVSTVSPYRKKDELIEFFEEVNLDNTDKESLSKCDPSNYTRLDYTKRKIQEINATPTLFKVFHQLLDDRNFLETNFKPEKIVNYLNNYLKHDGYQIVKASESYEIRDNRGVAIEFELPFPDSTNKLHLYIDQQSQKCDQKIRSGDFEGAITNARTLLEAVCHYIKTQSNQPYATHGNLPNLYKDVETIINCDPLTKDIPKLAEMLEALSKVVLGLSTVSNKAADRHARQYEPKKYHAVAVVNASKTVANFIFESFQLTSQNINAQVIETDSADEAADEF